MIESNDLHKSIKSIVVGSRSYRNKNWYRANRINPDDSQVFLFIRFVGYNLYATTDCLTIRFREFQMNMRSPNDAVYQELESYTADEFLWIGSVSKI